MKMVLACLMCVLLMMAEAFAISGGPFGGGSQVDVRGRYAGVFVPIPTVLDPGPPEVTLTDNSLALFTLVIPNVGLATGTSAVFRNGYFYEGTIQGSADPDSAKLTGIIAASFELTNPVRHYNANGQFVNTSIQGNQTPGSSASTRIRGRASITYQTDANDPDGDSGGPIFYRVKGFKQASTTN